MTNPRAAHTKTPANNHRDIAHTSRSVREKPNTSASSPYARGERGSQPTDLQGALTLSHVTVELGKRTPVWRGRYRCNRNWRKKVDMDFGKKSKNPAPARREAAAHVLNRCPRRTSARWVA